jgi:hypothetical protein
MENLLRWVADSSDNPALWNQVRLIPDGPWTEVVVHNVPSTAINLVKLQLATDSAFGSLATPPVVTQLRPLVKANC